MLAMLLVAALADTAPPVRVLVAYYSKGGHTKAMAKAVVEGVKRSAPTEVTLKAVDDVKCDDLKQADALVVGSPVYWSNMAGEVKTFFDRFTTECQFLPPAFPMKDKVGAAFVTGGEVSGGKEIALMTMLAAMLANRMIVVSEGQALGAAATTGDGHEPVAEKELDEARRLGERVVDVARRIAVRR